MCSPEQLMRATGGSAHQHVDAQIGLPSMPSTPTSRSVFIEQLLLGSTSALLAASSCSSTSDLTSNRSLPTMGVSMLGKKRLSSVSTDAHAIEKALLAHSEAQQQQQQLNRNNSNSALSTTTTTSPLARSVSMNASPCSPSSSSARSRPVIVGRESCTPDRNQSVNQWEKQIEQTVMETTKRLLKN